MQENIENDIVDKVYYPAGDCFDSDCRIDESIEDLVNSGWIEYADKSERRFTSKTKITLHPLVCDIVKNELKPELTDDKCRKFYVSFLDLIKRYMRDLSL